MLEVYLQTRGFSIAYTNVNKSIHEHGIRADESSIVVLVFVRRVIAEHLHKRCLGDTLCRCPFG